MKIFINLPYFPWGSFGLPFLNIATLSEGPSTIQIPLSQLCLHQLLKYTSTHIFLPKEKEGDRLTVIPFTKEVLWESSIEDHCFSSLVPLLVPTTSSQTNRDKSSQTEEALSFSTALG